MADKAFHNDAPLATITTDASQLGSGTTQNNQVAAGVWSQTEATNHTMCWKWEAIVRAIQHWRTSLAGHVVTVCSDNTTTVAYINHHRGTRSVDQLQRVWDLLLCFASPWGSLSGRRTLQVSRMCKQMRFLGGPTIPGLGH